MSDIQWFDIEYTGEDVPDSAIVVDAATSGNPGLSMYKGVLLPTGEVLFEKNICAQVYFKFHVFTLYLVFLY